MPIRKESFVNEDYYHVYNQGVDKQNIFIDDYDLKRFLQGMVEFNTTRPIGSLYENSFLDNNHELRSLRNPSSKLVNIVCYCLNPNHFHLVLEQVSDNGVQEFLRKIGGYSRYFNLKYERKGPLFQGRFKAKRIDTNDYLLHLSTYVNLNDKVHQLRNPSTKLTESSSWREYIDDRVKGICKKDYVLDHFKSRAEYQKYAEDVLPDIIERKNDLAQLRGIVLEDY